MFKKYTIMPNFKLKKISNKQKPPKRPWNNQQIEQCETPEVQVTLRQIVTTLVRRERYVLRFGATWGCRQKKKKSNENYIIRHRTSLDGRFQRNVGDPIVRFDLIKASSVRIWVVANISILKRFRVFANYYSGVVRVGGQTGESTIEFSYG